MGCRYSRVNGCYSLTCCCCVEANEACCWVAAVGLVWGGVATLVDFIAAQLPEQYCQGCLDYTLNANLSLAAGCINSVQWAASFLLLLGAIKENRWLLLPWLAWGVVSLAMQCVWVAVTLPYTPSIRGLVSLFQLAWGAHYFLVVKTHYARLALSFVSPEETSLAAPPNTPARRHKRRWRRLHPGCQPAFRTLLGAALTLHRDLEHAKKMGDEEEKEGDEKEEEEGVCVVGSDGGIGKRGNAEGAWRRKRGRWTPHGQKAGDTRGQNERDAIIYTSDRDVKGNVVEEARCYQKNREEEEEEEEGAEVGVTVSGDGGVSRRGNEEATCIVRDRRANYGREKTGSTKEQDECDVIIHTPGCDVRGKVVQKKKRYEEEEEEEEANGGPSVAIKGVDGESVAVLWNASTPPRPSPPTD